MLFWYQGLSLFSVSIGCEAFYGCRELTSVIIPGSVTNISSQAFWNCTALATINFAGTVEQWGNVTKGDGWNSEVPATKVVCSDGEVTLQFFVTPTTARQTLCCF